MALLKCLPCGRTGDEIGKCGSFLTCPKVGTPLDPADILLNCELCGITRVVAAGRVMQGKALASNPMCPVETCQARPVFLSTLEPHSDPDGIAAKPLAKKAASSGKGSSSAQD